AIKEPIDHHFLVTTCQHAAQLPSTAVALLSKVAFGSKCIIGSTGQTAHIHIEDLVVSLVIMLIALTVLAVDQVQRLFHLLYILGGTRIQRILHHRLFGTATAPKGTLQSNIGSQAR